MSGLNQEIVYSVARLEADFVNDIGDCIGICGTGFWILDRESLCFVTNRHNLDPTIKFGDNTTRKLRALRIQYRHYYGPMKTPTTDSRFFEVDLAATSFLLSKDTDAAIVFDPVVDIDDDAYSKPKAIPLTEIADTDFLSMKLAMMDGICFLGFPGSKNPWWDTDCNLAIARSAVVASMPGRSFTNPTVKWQNTIMVSGMSFSGSSGSPVFSFEKGVNVGKGLSNPGYVPPKLIGIMSGHWWEEDSTPEMFRHTGLSYLTRSTSILDLVNSRKAANSLP